MKKQERIENLEKNIKSALITINFFIERCKREGNEEFSLRFKNLRTILEKGLVKESFKDEMKKELKRVKNELRNTKHTTNNISKTKS